MQPKIQEVSFHKTLHDLPLNKFIDCIVDNNLSALTISGFPKEEELTQAWHNILGEYIESVGSQEYRMYVAMFKDVAILKITYDQVTTALKILQVVYDPFFAKEVNKLLRTDFKFNWQDPNTYEAEIKKCFRRSKALKIRLDLKNLQFAAIQKKNENKEEQKMDRQYFTSILVTLSDHAKYRIEETIKMSEYCERIKRFSDYCERLKKT